MSPRMNYLVCSNLYEEYRMVYYEWGKQEGAKGTLLCLHGLNRNGRDWDFMAKYFSTYGYYVIAPDIVGRGNSDYLKNPAGYEILHYSADILKLIKTLSLESVSVLGTSMGGLVGMAISAMENHPIKRLILNDIGAELEFEGLNFISSYNSIQPEFNNFSEAKDYLIRICPGFGLLPDSVWDYITFNSFQKNVNSKIELKRDIGLVKPFNDETTDGKNLELWSYWERVKIPTFVIRGENSKLLSNSTIARMESINTLTQHMEIKNAGHAPFLYLESHAQSIRRFLEN